MCRIEPYREKVWHVVEGLANGQFKNPVMWRKCASSSFQKCNRYTRCICTHLGHLCMHMDMHYTDSVKRDL